MPYNQQVRLRAWIGRLRALFTRGENTQKVLANAGWMLCDRLLRMAIAVLVGAWIARHLGPALFGELAYILAFLALFLAACGLGLDGPVVRDVTKDPGRATAVLGSAFRLRLAAGTVGWLTAILVVALLRPADNVALAMVALAGAALLFNPAEVVDLWLQSQGKTKISVPFRLSAYVAVALAKIVLILIDAPLWTFAAAALLDMVFVAIGLFWVYKKWPAQGSWRWDGRCARHLIKESWPLMFSALAVAIYMRIDQVMLRELSSERELGLYFAVLPFSQAWHIVPIALCASFLPRASQLQETEPVQYQMRLQQLFTLMAWSAIFVSSATAISAPWLVKTLLGPHYVDAIPILRWHVFTNVFVFLGVAQNVAIVSERTPRHALLKTISGAATSVLANCLLIPHWGAVGAAWSALLSYGVSAVVSNAVVSPHIFVMQIRSFIFAHAKNT
jgi:O-antigen/teichoic acid export membrane protein